MRTRFCFSFFLVVVCLGLFVCCVLGLFIVVDVFLLHTFFLPNIWYLCVMFHAARMDIAYNVF